VKEKGKMRPDKNNKNKRHNRTVLSQWIKMGIIIILKHQEEGKLCLRISLKEFS